MRHHRTTCTVHGRERCRCHACVGNRASCSTGPIGPTGAVGAFGPTGSTGPSASGEVIVSGVGGAREIEAQVDFVDLIVVNVPVTAPGSRLLIEATWSALAFTEPSNLRLAIDGVPVSESGSEVHEYPNLGAGRFVAGAITRLVNTSPGVHVVALQVKTGATGVFLVGTNPDRSHSSLVVSVKTP